MDWSWVDGEGENGPEDLLFEYAIAGKLMPMCLCSLISVIRFSNK